MAILRTPLILLAGLLVAAPSLADGGSAYEVTITNLTRSQIISPPVVAAHRRGFRLFEAGGTPSPGLEALAEDGITGDLLDELDADARVLEAVAADGGIPPATSRTVILESVPRNARISVVGMLVTTNDGFLALQGLRPTRQASTNDAPVYDAGSEANSESCEHIPGPPCGSAGASPDEPGEGFIHIHNGIHGVADLAPAEWDWRGEVARVSIRRVR